MIIVNDSVYRNTYDESNDNKTKIKECITKIIKVLLTFVVIKAITIEIIKIIVKTIMIIILLIIINNSDL